MSHCQCLHCLPPPLPPVQEVEIAIWRQHQTTGQALCMRRDLSLTDIFTEPPFLVKGLVAHAKKNTCTTKSCKNFANFVVEGPKNKTQLAMSH